jgi:catechol 2,3-dioxygenase-like lactoylglutathione lyase family enzyme
MGPDVKHLHLASHNHAASRGFYETYFGFHFDRIFSRGEQASATVLRAPSGFQIFLEGPSSERLPSWFHFGFLVESDAACLDLHDRMQSANVPIARPLVSVPFTNYFFTDPDGYLVQAYFDPKGS